MFKNTLSKIIEFISRYPLLVTVSLYLISILIVQPWGNYPVNDDFYYYTQVQAFSIGVFKKSALITPTFILQGYLGLLWSALFGISYVSLRFLTIFISILCLYIIFKILLTLNVKKTLILPCLLSITFNPIFFASSLTFMTENYFLLFWLLSTLFFIKSQSNDKIRYLVISSIFGGLSTLIRQYGFVLFPIFLIIDYYKPSQRKISRFLAIVLPFVVISTFGFLYPKYINPEFPKSFNILMLFTSLKSLFGRIFNIHYLSYSGFILLPFTISKFIDLKRKEKISIGIISAFVGLYIYEGNLFKIGNIFYLEGLYAKMFNNIRLNLLNNIPFKLLLSFLISISIIVIIESIIKKLMKPYSEKHNFKIHISKTSLLLEMLILSFYLIALITDKFYDRYLLNFFVITTIYSALKVNKYNYKNLLIMYFIIFLVSSITFLITVDYYRQMNLKWKMVEEITRAGEVKNTDIFLDSVYIKSALMEERDNYSGMKLLNIDDYNPICFIQEYSEGNGNYLAKLFNYLNEHPIIIKHLPNPRIENVSLLKSKDNDFDLNDRLIMSEEYTTPIYNLIGEKMFVRTFCKY